MVSFVLSLIFSTMSLILAVLLAFEIDIGFSETTLYICMGISFFTFALGVIAEIRESINEQEMP